MSHSRVVFGPIGWALPFFMLFAACEDTPPGTETTAGTSSALGGGAGASGSGAGGSLSTGGTAGAAGAGGATAGSSSQAGGGGQAGSSTGGVAGASGGGAAGVAGVGGGAGGSGGAGGAACGALDKAKDGSYVASGFTAEYTCSGGTCPAKNGADVGDVATNAFDDDYQTRWSTGVFQSALANQNEFPLYFKVDMKQAVPVSKITTHPGCKDIFDSPGTIEVEVSTNGTDFTTVTAMPHTPAVPNNEACPPNASSVATDTITFPTTCARYVRLKGTHRTTSDRYWAIGEMNIYP